jgi:glycine C-acetyltransferase
MNERLQEDIAAELDCLREAGTYKTFNTLTSPMDAEVTMLTAAGIRREVIVLSSNNYLGLAAHPEVVRAGIEGLERYGAGTASVRFICGTFAPHLELEAELASFLRTEAATTYVSCWCANEALIPTLTDANTVILSDALNHASLIDAIRLSRPARKMIYSHSSMEELRDALMSCEAGQRKLIVTDGVFSMEGDLARLPEIVELAEQYEAGVIVDDSHGTGVLGATGRGTAEHYGVMDRVDLITGTLGKALGGAAGGFVAGPRVVCDLLAQRSRPQLFSNALPPTVACSARRALQLLRDTPELLGVLRESTRYFREGLQVLGLHPLPGESAIVPILVGETAFAIRLSRRLLDEGIFVTGFGYPVVPEGTARIRVQLSAAHKKEHLDRALEAFGRIAAEIRA